MDSNPNDLDENEQVLQKDMQGPVLGKQVLGPSCFDKRSPSRERSPLKAKNGSPAKRQNSPGKGNQSA